MRRLLRISLSVCVSLLVAAGSLAARAQDDDDKKAINPLRLSYVGGQVSFWRYGTQDWVAAQLNTPLAAGDALYVGRDSELELQMGGRAFVRADDDTQLTLVNQDPDFLQIRITSGRVSLDLRTLPTGYAVELDTPNAVFSIDRVGYYRVDVNGDVHFITRRGGRAVVVPAGGEAMSIRPSEEIVVQGTTTAHVATYVAPELDRWDRWNYDRTDELVDTVSERYLSPGVAGARELDHYGSWRVVPQYGTVWVPDAVPTGWAPYSAGRWIWDPYYQWTWVDDAPWGWAPFHYGRWVYVSGYWAWCPGPVVVSRPVYAPALVAFYGVRPGFSVGIGIGSSGLAWVALGWGEPLLPWWGHPGFVGRPWWGGWGGPRVVNNVVVKQTTVVNVTNIHYANVRVTNAVVATTADHFGRGHVREAPVQVVREREREMEQIRGALPVKPDSLRVNAGAPKGERPPQSILERPVIATRAPRESKVPWRVEQPQPIRAAEPRYVPAPKRSSAELPRPQFGTEAGPERMRPPLPPAYEERKRGGESASTSPPAIARERPDLREPGAAPSIERGPQAERAAPPVRSREPQPELGREQQPTRAAPPQTPAPRQERERVPSPVQERMPEPREVRPREQAPRVVQPQPRPQDRVERVERPQRAERADLPGNPANRVYRGHVPGQGDQRRSERPAR
jgi:hypothetical protein